MEYERIEKVQTGIISPSKLRMKLLGPHHHRKKDGPNSNSARTSPSRLDDAEFMKNSLLASETDNTDDQVTSPSLEVLSLKPSGDVVMDQGQSDRTSRESKEAMARKNGDVGRVKMQHFLKADGVNSSAIHPMKTTEDEILDYDSNASSSSFEFHKGERPGSNPATRSLLRPIPSKWNDAEKWILNRKNIPGGYSRKNVSQNQANRLPATSIVRAAPESTNMGFEKFSLVPSGTYPISGEAHGRNPAVASSLQSKDLKEVKEVNLSSSTSTDETDIPGIRSVAMRDMGTEMTPVTSQEPSRSVTPLSSTSPLHTPTSSMPSTPRGVVPAPTPLNSTTDEDSRFPVESNKEHLTEEEIKLKTRREIAALGMQLGKMSIAKWASKDEEPEKKKLPGPSTNAEEQKSIELERRAALWEEAEKSKQNARHKREEIKIQAWESQQKAKLEAEMRKIEAKVEQMKAQAEAKMVKKIAMARQISEEKRAAAEARRNQEAEKTAAKAEYIRQTGQMPSANYICCGWL